MDRLKMVTDNLYVDWALWRVNSEGTVCDLVPRWKGKCIYQPHELMKSHECGITTELEQFNIY